MDRLLKELQGDLPIVEKPFSVLAESLGIEEEEVLNEIRSLKEKKIVRQISPIFDTRAAGYTSALVAFKVKENLMEKVVNIVNSHPGVSHNYERNHSFNLWFTLAVPPDSKFGLDETVRIMAELGGVEDYVILRTLQTFKIGVKLTYDSIWEREKIKPRKPHNSVPVPLSIEERNVIRHTQVDIPLVEKPFMEIGVNAGMSEAQLIENLRALKKKGVMRRFSAILYHRKAGFKANGMVVWRVKRSRVEEVGTYISQFKAVSHCYERTTGGSWRYNLFSMVHGRTREEVEEFAKKVAQKLGLKDFAILYSSQEFKKKRIKLFSEEFYEWENRYLPVHKH